MPSTVPISAKHQAAMICMYFMIQLLSSGMIARCRTSICGFELISKFQRFDLFFDPIHHVLGPIPTRPVELASRN